MLTIHQPEHAPWMGLLDKINKSDLLVILDNVQFSKNGFQNRNKVRSGWITVPVKAHPLATDIKDIEIAEVPWKAQYLAKLQDYKGELFYRLYYPEIKRIISQKHTHIAELNMSILAFLMGVFDIQTTVVRASAFPIPEGKDGSEKVLNICKYFEADDYLSGEGGKDYLRLDEFKGINVVFNDTSKFEHLSAFDHLLRYGAN